ncbi:MAG: hypothetical protein Kow00109_06640 [Acidobacteriota bacterium]
MVRRSGCRRVLGRILVVGLVVGSLGNGRLTASSLAGRLGYGPDAKLLIIHADDLGLAHSVNRASFEALRKGAVSSASIMMPCPWVREVVEFQTAHPEADIGLHLTLNSEWRWLKWGPVASRDRVPGLLDPFGFLWPSVEETVARATAAEVETELRAQIELAYALGLRPTHLDTHMGTVLRSKEFLEVYLKLGREYRLPVFLARPWLNLAPYAQELAAEQPELLDGTTGLFQNPGAGGWPEAYAAMIRRLQPGVTQMIVHLAYDDEEMRGVAHEHPDFGSAWRQADFDTVTSEAFRQVLRDEGVRLITWRDIGRALGLTGRE